MGRNLSNPRGASGYSIMRRAVSALSSGALGEATLSTPVNSSLGLAMKILRVRFEIGLPTLTTVQDSQNEGRSRVVLSTRQDLTAIPTMSDVGFIAGGLRNLVYEAFAASTDRQVNHSFAAETGLEWDFGPDGLIVADPTLSIYGQQSVTALTGSVAALEADATFRVVIYYQIVQLTAEEFLAALSLHENIS